MKALSTRLFALNEAWKENANIYRQMAKQMNLTDIQQFFHRRTVRRLPQKPYLIFFLLSL